MERITLESIPIVVGREEDGRWWADIESMPGVMAYGDTQELAIAAVRARFSSSGWHQQPCAATPWQAETLIWLKWPYTVIQPLP